MKTPPPGAASLLKLKLGDRLRSLGFRQGHAISQAGFDLMSRAAKRERLPDWHNATTPIDFVRLTRAVERELDMEDYV